MDRARTYASKADLVIYVIDASTELDESDYEIMDLLQDKKAIVLLNKSDLDTKVTVEEVQHILIKRLFRFLQKNIRELMNWKKRSGICFSRVKLLLMMKFMQLT